MASLLQTNQLVFAFISFSLECFALFPLLCHNIKVLSVELHYWATWVMFLLTVCLLMPLSKLIALLYFGTALLLTIGGPLWFLAVQRFKNQMSGPWDLATVQVRMHS